MRSLVAWLSLWALGWIIWLCVALNIASAAYGAPAWGPGTENYDGWPPARSTRDGAAYVHFVQPSLVAKACDENDPQHVLEACQFGSNIVLPNPCTFPKGDDYARLACHELAHSPRNGWPESHPR